jgi:hypothetical protein
MACEVMEKGVILETTEAEGPFSKMRETPLCCSIREGAWLIFRVVVTPIILVPLVSIYFISLAVWAIKGEIKRRI